MEKLRVRTLLRVSSQQQLKDNDIPTQRAELADYISKQAGWKFDTEYMEKGISAYKNSMQDREVLKQILMDAEKKEFDILLAYMSDRIGRRDEYSTYISMLNEMGVEVWTVKDGQLKTEEHIDKLLNFIRFWQNEGESKKTSARVKDALQLMVKEGKFVGGKAPFGYELVPTGEVNNKGRIVHRLTLVEEKAEIVRLIFHYAIIKGWGYDKIAKQLNSENVPSPTGIGWKAGTIASILKNPIYMGYIAYNRRKNHGSFERLDRNEWLYSDHQVQDLVIVSRETWERAQEIREARKNRIQSSKQANSENWEEVYNAPFSTRGTLALTGLVYCGYCGKRLKNGSYVNKWTVKSTGEEKIAFSGRYNCPEKCKERSCYSQKYLEGIVFGVVERYMEQLGTVDILPELEKMQLNQSEKFEKEKKQNLKEQNRILLDIKTLESRIPEALRGEGVFSAEILADLIGRKKEDLDHLKEKESEIEINLQSIKVEAEEMQAFVQSIPSWKDEFRNADPGTKRMILSAIIEKITVRDDKIDIEFKIKMGNFIPETIYETV